MIQAYLGFGTSQLSFWHETPEVNEDAFMPGSRQYYMTFRDKADYAGPFDADGIPLLDYRGKIGQQYNPIAVAQYGLGCWNRFETTDNRQQTTDNRRQTPNNGHNQSSAVSSRPSVEWHEKAVRCADWLVENLEQNRAGQWVWHHKFDWEYFQTLKAPWYSGLAQGMGISLLVRAEQETGEAKYGDAADRAFAAMSALVKEGGTRHVDENGDWWIEEYITSSPTHILNGFMWALWGVRDYGERLKTEAGNLKKRDDAKELWEKGVKTVERNLERFDCGYWSLYDLSPVSMKNVASPFYHRLHIVQLDVMHRLTGKPAFREFKERWQRYQAGGICRARALAEKVAFKLAHF